MGTGGGMPSYQRSYFDIRGEKRKLEEVGRHSPQIGLLFGIRSKAAIMIYLIIERTGVEIALGTFRMPERCC